MRKGFLASVAAVAAGAGLAFGQAPAPAPADYPAWPGDGGPVIVPVSGGHMSGPIVGHGPPSYGYGPGPMGGPGMPMPPGYGGAPPEFAGGPGGPGCGPDGCGGGGGSFLDRLLNHNCGQPGPHGGWAPQVHQAAGGPDCFYADIEGMYLFFRSMPVNAPLLTRGPNFPVPTNGIIGEQGVSVIAGGEPIESEEPHVGLRLTIGKWDSHRRFGWEASGFLTEQRAEIGEINVPANGRFVVGRPFIDSETGTPLAIIVASPNGTPFSIAGAANVYTNSRLSGAEINSLCNIMYYDRFKFNSIVGLRWANLNEKLLINTTSVQETQPFPFTDPSLVEILDTFTARNNFYGAQVGLRGEYRRGRCFIDATGKIAGGVMVQELSVDGATRSVINGVQTIQPGGAYAVETNSGRRRENEFAWLPELNLKLGYQITQRMSAFVGYNVMYFSDVVRPGEQVDQVLNQTFVPSSAVFNQQFPFGQARPAPRFETSEFWAMGVNFGLSFRY